MRQRVPVILTAVAGAMAIAAATAGPATASAATASAAAARSAAARRAPAHNPWGKAALLPGAGSLGSTGADGTAVSCSSTGNCTAGGNYFNGSAEQAFVIGERRGHWGKAVPIPGLSALNTGSKDAELDALSCPSAGNCIATGTYFDSAGRTAYVAVQRSGRWSKAEEIPGLAALNLDGDAEPKSVSCASPGNCAVGGSYLDGSDLFQAFVVTLSNWHWADAIEVPGTSTLNAGGMAQLVSLSCRKAGNCSAGGYYKPTSSTTTAFVITEKSGHWGNAVPMPGLAALNVTGQAALVALSCGSAGNCTAGGYYRDAKDHQQAFLATQKNGKWNKAAEARGTGAMNVGGSAQVNAVSCPAAGDCSAGGYYERSSNHLQLFLISEHKGTWGKAIVMPGILSHNKGSSTQIFSLSCSSAGNCSAGGYFENATFREFAFVSTESGGHWGAVIEVPGISVLSAGGDSQVVQLSCPATGHCVGVGDGTGAAHKGEAIDVTRI